MDDELLTVKEVAALVKFSEQTVRKLVKQGELPGERVGRRILIPKRKLEERLSPNHPANAPRPPRSRSEGQ